MNYYWWDVWKWEPATWGSQTTQWELIATRPRSGESPGWERQTLDGAGFVDNWLGNYYLSGALYAGQRTILVRRWIWNGKHWVLDHQQAFK